MPDHVDASEEYEHTHVHTVYDQIATHFSSTRYKPWPIIAHFLQTLPAGSIGLDVGCGNGKYLVRDINPNIFIVGSDRSRNLAAIAAAKGHQPHEVVVGDVLMLPHRAGVVDFVVCIAVVHHLSTVERRVGALGGILECLNDGGRALVFVWALEQGGSRRGWKEGDEQDVMVPWVTRGSKKGAQGKGEDGGSIESPTEDKVFYRYYHLYAQGELERDIRSAGGVVMDSGYEKDNWWAVCKNAPV